MGSVSRVGTEKRQRLRTRLFLATDQIYVRPVLTRERPVISSPFVHRKEDEISRRLRDVPDVFLSPLSQAPPTLHPRPAHTPSQGGTLALRPLPDAIPRDRRARSSRATPQFARRLSQVLGHSFPPDWIGHKATIECFIVSAPLTKVPPRLPPAPRRNNRRNGKG